MLDYVLRPNAGAPAARFVIPNLDLVELLLTQEANANQDFQQCTVWSRFLIYLYNPSRRDQKVTEDRSMLGSGPFAHPARSKSRPSGV